MSEDMLIWKFVLAPWATHHEMPKGARIVHVAAQGENICVWAECDPDAPKVLRGVRALPTGARVNGGAYIGTALLEDGALVFHVYDLGEP